MKASINQNNEKVAEWQKLWTLRKNDTQEKPLKNKTVIFYSRKADCIPKLEENC